MEGQHRVADEAAAVKIANRLTRFDTLTSQISAQRETVTEDKTPFLWKQFIGKRAWRVDFENVSLKLSSSIPGYPDSYRRKFTVLIDEETGRLLSISSKFEGEAPDMRPLPSGEAAEAQLQGQQEVYLGLPTIEPKIKFLDALDLVLSKGVGSPFLAKEIYGVYVLDSRMKSPARAVWAITLRGLPPIPVDGPYGDTVPVWQRNHMRNVLDATTGEHLFATNSPQPD